MNIKKTTSYVFENDYLQYESFVKNFDDKEFKEFEEVAKKIGLEGKIDDLISGKIVNKSENQAAFHPKYRSYENNQNRPKNIIDAEDQAFKFFSTRWNDCKDNQRLIMEYLPGTNKE